MIEVKHVSKSYGSHRAVDDLNFTMEMGCVYGFLGPNGAGKSTTMNIITGCLSASEGTVLVGGYDIFENPIEAKRLIGYLPEIPPLYLDMTPEEYLVFVASAKGIKKAERKKEISYALERTGLMDVKNRLIKQLSKGYKQRVGIAQALLGNPPIIVLDEPTVGLDPKQIIEIRELILSLKEDHTVILSSHIMQEVASVCDHIIIINHGKLVTIDTPEHLHEEAEKNQEVLLLITGKKEEIELVFAGYKGYVEIKETEQVGTYQVHVKPQTMSLEEVFLELTDQKDEKEEMADDSDL